MNSDYREALKMTVQEQMSRTQILLGYSHREMARRLHITLRTYDAIDEGSHGCSCMTLLMFLVYCCPDPAAFVAALKDSLAPFSVSAKNESELEFRYPMTVKEIYRFKDRAEYPLCPKCGSTLEWEYQSFCDRCGQKLSWKCYDDASVCFVSGKDGKHTSENMLFIRP